MKTKVQTMSGNLIAVNPERPFTACNLISQFTVGNWIAIGCLLILGLGCSKSTESYPISGNVLIDDRPESGVYLTFQIKSTSNDQPPIVVSAVTDSEGKFNATAPAIGDYTVKAFWPSTVQDEGIPMEGPDQFNGKYRKEGTIPAVTVTEDGTEIETVHLNTAD